MLALASLWISPGAAAQEPARPGVDVVVEQAQGSGYRPVPFFDFVVRRNVTPRGRLTVENPGDETMLVSIDPVDARTAPALTFAYALRQERRRTPQTDWLRLGRRRLELRPGQSGQVRLALRVPARAGPGDYLAGVSVEVLNQKPQADKRDEATIATRQRYAVGVLARIPGPRRAQLRLAGAEVEREPGGVAFLLDARNEGNALLRDVSGRLLVTRDGATILDEQIGPGTFLAKTRTDYSAIAPDQIAAPGTQYRVRASLSYEDRTARIDRLVRFDARDAEIQRSFVRPAAASPDRSWTWALAAAAALLGIGLTGLWLRRRARSGGGSEVS